MTKRKEHGATLNKIVNTGKVLSRGQRVPALELTFKQDGYRRDGHQVYIDYRCAVELMQKLSVQVQEIEAAYFPAELHNRINKAVYEGAKLQQQ